jgi:hypothetical protein
LGAVVALGVAAGTAALPPSVSLMIVRDNTNYFKPVLLLTKARVKRNLAAYPDLLKLMKKNQISKVSLLKPDTLQNSINEKWENRFSIIEINLGKLNLSLYFTTLLSYNLN